ncbi:MAG TPA: TIGR02594 family protein [Anaerolineae bacterium]|nr:TIGR02594 family protein [Anaerolineae bacterium]
MTTDGNKPRPPVVPREHKPVWMAVAEAEGGVRELPGAATNPQITEYYRATTLGGTPEDSTTPWCASFVCWVLEHAGYRSTRRANARSYLDYGEAVDEPRYGDLVVLWRDEPKGTKGHVGFYGGRHGRDKLWIWGGNQANGVCWALYGLGRVLAYRRPTDAERKQ